MIDTYLSQKYKVIPNIAYTQKRSVNKVPYSVFLNQMITPDAFEVLKFKKPFERYKDDVYKYAQMIGNALAKHTTWVDEQKLYDSGDFYYYPEETLTGMKNKIDCEECAFTMASFMPQNCAVCYGFYNTGKQKFGHAFPILVINNSVWIVETTGNAVEIVPSNDPRYEVYFIVTQFRTYQVKSGVRFGDIAQW